MFNKLDIFDKAVVIVLGFVLVLLFISIGFNIYYKYSRAGLITDVNKLKVERVEKQLEHKTELFENNQTIIFKKEKEASDEGVPGTIGMHTLSL